MITNGPSPSDYPVLLVEDNPELCRLLRETLSGVGYAALCVENAEQAIALLEKQYFAIVITDLFAPAMEGLDLCRAIRQRFNAHYIYTIVLTSSTSREDLIEGLEAGADEYLFKPVDDAELRARLKIARRILELERSLKKSLSELQDLSSKDALTGFYNRRYLIEHLPLEIKRAARYGRPLSIVLFDLDHFKSINDRFGHSAGDQVLRQCGACVRETVRQDLDWATRYGGEEFLLVLPETDYQGAMIVAERLKNRLAEQECVFSGQLIRTTASFGVAALPQVPQQQRLAMETLIECADRCLYEAKGGGRNCVRGQQL